ncbi:MAG: carbohydrate-binding protein [Clostridia bacterium]|nr:carbohydrate-binding protein [Clostridia bacterium]
MKKILAVLMATALTVSMAAVAGAATTMSADKPVATVVLPIEDAEIIDDDTTQDQGGNNTFISIVDGYGCGNSSLNDKVVWDVDLAADANSVSLLFGYGKDDGSVTTIDVDVDGEVVATMEVPFTGGWDIASAQWVTVPAAIPAGSHSVGFTFTSANSGSFSQVAFSSETYLDLTVVNDASVIDEPSTNDVGGSGNPIQIMDAYGCGYSSKGDIVVFEDVDFGANGASTAVMRFGYGNDNGTVSELEFYIDDPDGDAALKLDVGFTGGWDIATSGYVPVELAVPAGVHSIYVKFVGDASGSISELHFVEAEPAPVEEVVEGTAPATFDAGVVAAVAAIISAAGYAVSKKH